MFEPARFVGVIWVLVPFSMLIRLFFSAGLVFGLLRVWFFLASLAVVAVLVSVSMLLLDLKLRDRIGVAVFDFLEYPYVFICCIPSCCFVSASVVLTFIVH